MTEISRIDLYNLIWSEPTTKIAERFERSDVWISKICKQYNIPKPPRGYWAKLNSGRVVKQIPLPKKDENPCIYFRKNIAFIKKNNNKISRCLKNTKSKVEENLKKNSSHEIVHRFQEILLSCAISSSGVANFEPLQVSPDSFERALRILNALFNIISEHGFVKFDEYIILLINNNEFKVRIIEELLRRKIECSPKSLRGEYEFYFDRYEWEYFPSGKLKIEILKPILFGNRKLWRDTELKSLEMQMAAFINFLMSYSK